MNALGVSAWRHVVLVVVTDSPRCWRGSVDAPMIPKRSQLISTFTHVTKCPGDPTIFFALVKIFTPSSVQLYPIALCTPLLVHVCCF